MTSSEKWGVSGPKVIEVGGPDETVHELRVALVAGRIDVVAHDEDEARVEVHRVRGRELEVLWDRGSLVVRHPQVRWDNILEGIRGFARGEDSADLSIAVPRGTTVQVGTVSADGLVAGVHAPASVRTVSGSLVLDGVHGTVGARTLSGQIDVRDQHGSLSGETVSGSLTVQAVELDDLDVKTVSGSLAVDLDRPARRIALKSVSGDLTVRIPADSGFRFDAKSVSGNVVADGRRIASGPPGNRAGELREGDEAVRISAKSVSGDVTLLRAAASGPNLTKTTS
ncbi:MAG TPA: DUF4097 family beta strand repeat-containing protein [Actinomycetales bacterium]|nr:DUF4097 family beta strand repeat-containing protein [Actinomycetales bacterium]